MGECGTGWRVTPPAIPSCTFFLGEFSSHRRSAILRTDACLFAMAAARVGPRQGGRTQATQTAHGLTSFHHEPSGEVSFLFCWVVILSRPFDDGIRGRLGAERMLLLMQGHRQSNVDIPGLTLVGELDWRVRQPRAVA